MSTWIFSEVEGGDYNEKVSGNSKDKYIEKFQAAINDLHGDGYELTDFQVVYDAGELWLASSV